MHKFSWNEEVCYIGDIESLKGTKGTVVTINTLPSGEHHYRLDTHSDTKYYHEGDLALCNKDRVICLVGASGTGKTTIAKELEKEGYNIIHSYTTRKPREKNEWGHTFIELINQDFIQGKLSGIRNKNGEMSIANIKQLAIAYFGDYSNNDIYFATEDQYKNKGTSIYIVDPDGAEQVERNVKDAEVITIYLMAEEHERSGRMFDNGRESTDIIDRLKKDREIFKVCKCDYSVDVNREVKEVLKDVIEIIEDVETYEECR